MSQSFFDRPNSGQSSVKRNVKRENSSTSLVVLPPEGAENHGASRESPLLDVNSRSSSSQSRRSLPSKKVSLSLGKKEQSSEDFGTFNWEEYRRLEAEKLSSNSQSQNQVIASSHIGNGDFHAAEHHVETSLGKPSSVQDATSMDSVHSMSMGDMLPKNERSITEKFKQMTLWETKACEAGTGRDGSTGKKAASGGEKTAKNKKTRKKENEGAGVDIEDSDEFDTDLEDGGESDGESSDEEEKVKVPTELLMEFLQAVMGKQWEIAQKLCTMILLYDPHHPEALTYKDVIEERIQFEVEKAAEKEGSDDSSSSSDDDSDEEDEDQAPSGSDKEKSDSSSEDEAEQQEERRGGKEEEEKKAAKRKSEQLQCSRESH